MTPCPPLEQLQRLLAEALPQPERALLDGHVERCPSCQQALARLTDDTLLRPSAPPAAAPTPLLDLRGRPANGAEPRTRTCAAPADEPPPAAEESLSLPFLAPAARADSLGRLGHYEVLQVLGRGGFGIVFRAFDDVLQRVVAIKVLAPELAATSPARKRFLREARAAAQVRHGNVVQIHAVEEQPLPYLVMEFVPGETLQQHLDRTGPLDAAEVAAIGWQIAEGLAAAHAAGLIHRDVKPSNVLLEAGPRLRVRLTDFGLARAADDASLTQSGAVAGTPLYMSPEQANGDRLDARSDLFSLGSVLYAIASGRPPFRAENPMAVLRRVIEDSPRPIPEVIPETPAWLCGVIARLMAKDLTGRFQTAAEVSAALEAGLAAPEARAAAAPPPAAWPRRLLLAGGALALAAVLALGVYLLPRPGPARQAGSDAGGKDRDNPPADSPRQEGRLPTPEELAALPAAADALKRADIPPALLAAAGGGKPADAPRELVAVLGGPPFLHQDRVGAVCFSPDGRLLSSCERDSERVKVWEASSGKELFSLPGWSGSAFSPDSKYLATATIDPAVHMTEQEKKKEPWLRYRRVALWDLQKRQAVRHFQGHTLWVRSIAFDPKGKRLLAAGQDRSVRIWDVADGKELLVFRKHTAEVPYAAFSPDGSMAASAGCDGTVRIWEADTGKELHVLRGHSKPFVHSVSFSPDGKRLVSCANQDYTAIVWDVETGTRLTTLETPHVRSGVSLWSPDGKVIAYSGAFANNFDNPTPVRLFDAESGAELPSLTGNKRAVSGLSFRADGKRLAGAGRDGRIHLWDMTTRKELVIGEGHSGLVLGVAISFDGKTLASAGEDRTVRLWDLASGQWRRTLTGHEGQVTSVAFPRDGKLLASGSDDGTVRLWDLRTGRARTLPGHKHLGIRVAFSPDGQTLASAGNDGLVKLWDLQTGKLLHDLRAGAGAWSPAFSPDGKSVAVGCDDGIVRRWETATGWELPALKSLRTYEVLSVAFHPGKPLLAMCGSPGDGSVRLWNLESHREVQRLDGHTGPARSCLWRADGQLLISAGWKDGTLRLWDLTGKTPRSKVIALGKTEILGLALSPEGRYLTTANADGTLYVLRLAKAGEGYRAR